MAPARAALGERLRRLLPAVWLGWMLCVVLLATPSAFALLARADAGRVAGRLLAGEAYTAIAFGVLLLVLERMAVKRSADSDSLVSGGGQFNPSMMLCLAALFCTVAGYFALLPMMDLARVGQGNLGFGQLHAISAAFFVVKLACVAVLAWRGTAVRAAIQPPSS